MMMMARGAKDTKSFEVKVSRGSMPSEQSITHEGIFGECFFKTGCEKEKLFSCAWSEAMSKDPISGKPEYYLCCGMNSKYDGEGIRTFGRPPLNLIIVLDISGSMKASFSGESKSKLEVAQECVLALLRQLKPDDNLGLILFDYEVQTLQPVAPVADIKMPALQEKVQATKPRGGTDMVIAYEAATKMLDAIDQSRKYESESRIMFLTDARPNSRENPFLKKTVQENAMQKKIYSTFFGVGIDFQVELVESLTKVKATNYFTVSSAKEFKKLMDEDFDYIVYPCCFNVKVKLDDDRVTVDRIYGSPGFEHAKDGLLAEMDSLFPSAKESEDTTKGGVVLIKFSWKDPAIGTSAEAKTIKLTTEYDDRDDTHFVDTASITFGGGLEDHYSSPAIRKAIVLTRYVNLMRWWIREGYLLGMERFEITKETGIKPAPLNYENSHGWQQDVSEHYKELFSLFSDWMAKQVDALDEDESLTKYLKGVNDLALFLNAEQMIKKMKELLTEEEILRGITATELKEKMEGAVGKSFDDQMRTFKNQIRSTRKEVIEAKAKEMLDADCPKLMTADQATIDELATKLISKFTLSEEKSPKRCTELASASIKKHLIARIIWEVMVLRKTETSLSEEQAAKLLVDKGFTISVNSKKQSDTAKALKVAISGDLIDEPEGKTMNAAVQQAQSAGAAPRRRGPWGGFH